MKSIATFDGKVQMMRRSWWQLFKFGWHRHYSPFVGQLWIRYCWPEEES